MQPGDTITPGSQSPEPPKESPVELEPQAQAPAAAPTPPSPLPEPQEVTVQPQPVVNQVPPSDQGAPPPSQQFMYKDDEAPLMQQPETEPVSWTASEFIAHQKAGGWYMMLALATIAGTSLVYLLTRDIISASTIVVIAIIVAVVAGRKPRTMRYQLTNSGIQIGDKFYGYNLFKSFSVDEEGAISSITFMPLKRFMPLITVYYDPQDEDKIANILSAHLPYEERSKDIVDQFMHKIRF